MRTMKEAVGMMKIEHVINDDLKVIHAFIKVLIIMTTYPRFISYFL